MSKLIIYQARIKDVSVYEFFMDEIELNHLLFRFSFTIPYSILLLVNRCEKERN